MAVATRKPGVEGKVVEELRSGRIKPFKAGERAEELRKADKPDENVGTAIRRQWREEIDGVSFEHVGHYSIDMNEVANDGLTIGAVQIPVKFVGEIAIDGQHAKGTYPVYVAALEGKLAAGMYRGIETFNLFNEAKGIRTAVEKDGMTRDVLVQFDDVQNAAVFTNWVNSPEGQTFMCEKFNSMTEHGKLIEAQAFMDTTAVHIRFAAATGAAMGMNMVTDYGREVMDAAISHVTKPEGILQGIHIDVLTPSGNLCTDKKDAHINMLLGRGLTVHATARLPVELVKERFFKNVDCTPLEAAKRLVRVNREKNERGTRLAGSYSANTHAANALAALYIAYGQDPAQVVEGSLATIYMELTDDDKYVLVRGRFPALELGTFMGETKWGAQRELLKASGFYGDGDETGKTRLAFGEFVAAVTMVADANLTAVQAAGEYGRQRPIDGKKQNELGRSREKKKADGGQAGGADADPPKKPTALSATAPAPA